MKKLLYIDSCVLRETSRTKRIADALVEHLLSTGEYVLEQLVLEKSLPSSVDFEDVGASQ